MEKRLASWKDVIVETRDYEYLDENLNIIQQKPFIWVWEMDFDPRGNELLIQIWDKVRTKRIPENLGVLIGLAKLWPNINGMVGQGEEAKLKPSSSQSDVREQILRVNAVKYGFSQLKKFDKNQVVKLLEPLIR